LREDFAAYGVTRLMRVPQLPSDVRVPPQLPIAPVGYSASVQVWPMYFDAIQIEGPVWTRRGTLRQNHPN
jgi:hypothetical protein